MKRLALLLVVAVGVAIVAAVVLPGDKQAAQADPGIVTPIPVTFAQCSLQADRYRPAGSQLLIRSSWGDRTPGVVGNFVKHQVTLVSVNDAPMIDISDTYSAPTFDDASGTWFTTADYDPGIVMGAPGTTVRFTYTLYLTARVPGWPDLTANAPIQWGPGLLYGGTCLVHSF